MATDATIAGFPWWEWPDYARVAAVLGALLLVVGLGVLIRWKLRSRAGMGTSRATRHQLSAEPMATERPPDGNARPEHEELPLHNEDPVLRGMHWVMRMATYVLALAMVVVILEGVVSVLHTLYLSMTQPPFFMVPDIVKTFGAFLAVLIAYEIFANITLYIRSDVFPVKLVVATAVMAVARKVIVLDMDDYTSLDLVGIGAVLLGLGITYWLISVADEQCGPARSGMTGGSARGEH